MKMCFPNRAQSYAKLPAVDDYSEQSADDAPLRPYDDVPESPASSRRSSLNSDGSSAYDPPQQAKNVAREVVLGLAESESTRSRVRSRQGVGDEERPHSGGDKAGAAVAAGKDDDENPMPPRSRAVSFAGAPKPLPPPPPMPSS